MDWTTRLTLISAAVLCGGFVAALGGAFSSVVEPDEYSSRTTLFWLLTGAVVALPLWAPAIVPSRFSRVAAGVRRLCALLLLAPMYMFSTIVTHNIRRALSGIAPTYSALMIGVVLTLACAYGVFILLRPDIRRLGDRRSNASSK